MKRFKLFWTLAAIAFAGAVAFVGCEKEQASQPGTDQGTNPDQNPNQDKVNPIFDDDTCFYSDGALVYLPPVSGRVHIGIDTTTPADSLSAILNIISGYGNIVGGPRYRHAGYNYESMEYILLVNNNNYRTSLFRKELAHSQYVKYVGQEHLDMISTGDTQRMWFTDQISVWVQDRDSNTIATALNTLGIAYNKIAPGIFAEGDDFIVSVASSESAINVANLLYRTGNFTQSIPTMPGDGTLILDKRSRR